MLTTMHAFWHAIEPYVFTFGALAFLVSIVRGMRRAFTATKVSKVYRAESPISFWFFVGLNLILGIAILTLGLSLLFSQWS